MTKKEFHKQANVIRVKMKRNISDARRRIDFIDGQRHFFEVIDETFVLIEKLLETLDKSANV